MSAASVLVSSGERDASAHPYSVDCELVVVPTPEFGPGSIVFACLVSAFGFGPIQAPALAGSHVFGGSVCSAMSENPYSDPGY